MTTLNITRGSDINFVAIWQDAQGDPVDLTGWEVLIFEPHSLLEGHLTVDLATPEIGRIKGRIEWSDAYGTGRVMGFQIWLKNGIEDRTSHRIAINVTTDYYANPVIIPVSNPIPTNVEPAPNLWAGGNWNDNGVWSDADNWKDEA